MTFPAGKEQRVPGWKDEQSAPLPGQLLGQSGVALPLQTQREPPAPALPQAQLMEVPAYEQLTPDAVTPAHEPVGGVAGHRALLQLHTAPPSAASQEQTVSGGYLQPPRLATVVVVDG